MKSSEPAIAIPPEIAAKCEGPDQFGKFDRLFRAVIATPKADIDKADAKWKRKQGKKRTKPLKRS